MNYKYYIFDVGSKDDSIDFENGRVDDLESIAKKAASDYCGKADIDTSWPIELILVNEAGKEHAFQIEIEYISEFSATQHDM